MAISIVLLAASLGVLFALNWLQRQGEPHMATEIALRPSAGDSGRRRTWADGS